MGSNGLSFFEFCSDNQVRDPGGVSVTQPEL